MLAILSLEIVDIALIVINRLDLFLKKFECKVSEQQPLHERQDAGDKSIRVAGLVHVISCPRRAQQVVEAEEHEKAQVQ